jgi:hypothetical protein
MIAVTGQAITLDAHVMCPPAHTRSCGSIPSAEHTCCIRHGNVRRDLSAPESPDAAVPMQLPRTDAAAPHDQSAHHLSDPGVIALVAAASGPDLPIRFGDLRL